MKPIKNNNQNEKKYFYSYIGYRNEKMTIRGHGVYVGETNTGLLEGWLINACNEQFSKIVDEVVLIAFNRI